MVVRLETNNGRKSLGLNRRKQSLPNHLITTNQKRTRFCHVLLMRNSLAPFKRICTISDHWAAYSILSICQKLAMEIMATNLPPTQLFSTEISTYSLTLRAHEPGEMNWSQELTYIHSTSCFIVFRKMFRKRDLNPWNWWFCPWRRRDVTLLCEHVRPAVRGLEDRAWCQAAKRSPGKERFIKYISNAWLGWPMRLRDSQLNKETLIPVVWRARVTVELELARQVKGAVQQLIRRVGAKATHFTINHLRLLMTTIVLHLEPWSMFLILLRNLPAVFIFIQFILLVCIHCWVDTHIRALLLSIRWRSVAVQSLQK